MADREDPLVGFNYGLELGGKAAGFFTECSGIGSESEVIEQKVVDERGNEIVAKIPGRLKWEDISLKRPVSSEMDLWDWQKEIDDGSVDSARINGSIVMFDQTHAEVARWNFDRGWIKKIGGPQLNADGNEIVLEEVVIAHEGLRRDS